MIDIITGKKRRKKRRSGYGEDYKIIKEKQTYDREYIPIADRHIDGA